MRLIIGEPDSTTGRTHWTDAQLMTALSISQDAIAAEIGAVERDSTIKLENGICEYDLPSDLMGVDAVYFWQQSGFNRVNWVINREFPTLELEPIKVDAAKLTKEAKTDADFVREYTWFATKLKIDPQLDGYSDADSLLVDYYAYPAALESLTQVSEMPRYTDLAVVMYADYILKYYNLNVTEAAQGLQNNGSMAALFVERYAKRQKVIMLPAGGK